MHPLPYIKFFYFLFFAMSSALMAADPLSYANDATATPLLDYFPIIVFSETGGAANIFQFISGFAQEFSSGDLWWIGVLAMGVATVAGTIKAFQKRSAGAGAKELIFPVIMAIVLLAPSESVRIYDGRTTSSTDVRIVDNVPWFVAATASVSSVFTARLMNIVDDASSVISSTTNFNYGAQGLAAPENFALRAIQKIRMDENITTAINTAVKECLVPNAVDSSMFNYIGTYKNAAGDFNSFEAMRQIPINDIDIFNTSMSNGQLCGNYISQNFSSTVENAFDTKIQAVLSNLNFLEIDNLAALSAQYFGMSNHPDVNDTYSQSLANFSGYLKNYNFEGALAGAIVNARAEAIGGGENTAIIAETVANASMGNLQTSGIGSWRALSELVPTAHNYLLIIIYGASALMALVVLASGYEKGMMILKEYFFGLITFEFIKVAFALANNVMLFYSQERALDLLSGAAKNDLNPASMPMIGQHLEYLANMAGMAGALGLAAMIMIPGIVFGGKVASAMGVLGNVGGMVQNKSPQSAVEDIAKAKGMQKANADIGMRAELQKAGIHVAPNSDVGSVYSAYMSDMDKSAKNTAESSMYRDYDKRYGAVKAQSIQSSAGMIGAGQAAEGYTYDQMKSAGSAVGATGFTGQMAQGQGLIAAGAVDGHGNVKEDYKMGQLGNAQLQATATRVAGREFSKMEFSPDKEGIEAAEKEISKHGTSAQDHLDQAKKLKEKAKNTKDPKTKKDLENQAKEHEKSAESELGLAEKGISNLQAAQKTGSLHSGLDAMMQSAIIAGKKQVADARATAGQFGYDGENGIAKVRNKNADAEKAAQTEIDSLDKSIKNLETQQAVTSKKAGAKTHQKVGKHNSSVKKSKGKTPQRGHGNHDTSNHHISDAKQKAKSKFQQKASSTGGVKTHPKQHHTDLRSALVNPEDHRAVITPSAHKKSAMSHTKKAKPQKGHIKKTSHPHSSSGDITEASTAKLTKEGLGKQIEAQKKAASQARGRLADIQKEPEFHSGTVDQVLKAEATKAAQSRIGSAIGAMQNMDKVPDMYARNAMYGEMSQAQSTLAKINAFGSINTAVGTDALGATRSAEQTKNDMRAFSDSFGGGTDLIKAMTQGGDEAAKKISDAMKGFGNVAYQTAHQGYQGQIGTAKGYVEERAKNGDNYQAKLAESSTKSQAESGMSSIKAMQDYKGLSSEAAINALAHQAGRQSYVQTKSTAQDMSMKDKAFGSAGYEDSGMTMARKQSDDAIGATKGTKHELAKRGDKGFQDVAQSGAESQVESGLGAIRGAGGIHSLAWQSGVKAQSDSNALKASIGQAGGAGAYIGLNEFAARKGISGMQSDRDGFNDEYNSKAKGNIFDKDYKPAGYLGSTGFEGYRLAGAAGAAKGYAEQKGTANAIGNTGTDVFQSNAQTETENSATSTKRKIEGAGGAQNYIIASSTAAAGQGASVASDLAGAGSQMNMIQNAAYGSFQKGLQGTKDRQEDTGNNLAEVDKKTGLTKSSELGEKGIENTAVANSIMKSKQASMREKVASMFDAGNFPDLGAKAATMKEYGLTDKDLANGGKEMSSNALGKFILNSEKRMEKMEMSVLDGHGNIATATTRNMASKNEDGSLAWKSQMENLSSFRNMQTGEKRDDHLADTVGAKTKNTIAGVAGADILTGLEALVVGGSTAYTASKAYDGFVNKMSSSGAKATMNSGKTAMKDSDGHWYEVDDKGDFVSDKEGKKTRADGDLKPTAKKAWDGAKNAAYDLKDRLRGTSSENADDKTSNQKQNGGTSGQDNITKHNETPNEKMTGSNPSHTNNYTPNQNPKQVTLAKAQENLETLKNASPVEHAKAEMQILAGEKEVALNQALSKGDITPTEYKQQMSGINSLKNKIASGGEIGIVDTQKAGITAKELSSAGMSTKTVSTGSGKAFQAVDLEASGNVAKAAAIHSAENTVHSAKQAVDAEHATTPKTTVETTKPSTPNKPQKRSEILAQEKQSLIDKQATDPHSPPMTKADYKEAISQYDTAIHEAKGQEARSAHKGERHQKRAEAREGRQASVFESMKENIAHSSVAETASDAMKAASGKMDEALQAAEHTGGGVKGKALAFGGTLLAGTALSSLFSSNAEAAEVPVSVKAVAKPVPASGGTLDNITDTLGLGALGTSAVGIASKTAAKVAPGVGAAYGVVDTANRTSKGDYAGAAMSAAIGGASMLPVGGTAVALGLAGVQIATDAMGITGGDNSKSIPQTHASTPTTAQHGNNTTSSSQSSATDSQSVQSTTSPIAHTTSQAPSTTQSVQNGTSIASTTTSTADKNNFIASASAESGAKNDATKTNMGISTLSEGNQAKVTTQADKDATAMMQMMSGTPIPSSKSAIVGETTLPSKVDIVSGMKQSADVEIPVKVNPKATISNMGEVGDISTSMSAHAKGVLPQTSLGKPNIKSTERADQKTGLIAKKQNDHQAQIEPEQNDQIPEKPQLSEPENRIQTNNINANSHSNNDAKSQEPQEKRQPILSEKEKSSDKSDSQKIENSAALILPDMTTDHTGKIVDKLEQQLGVMTKPGATQAAQKSSGTNESESNKAKASGEVDSLVSSMKTEEIGKDQTIEPIVTAKPKVVTDNSNVKHAGANMEPIDTSTALTQGSPAQTVAAKGADPVKPTETAHAISDHKTNTPNGQTVPTAYNNTMPNAHHNDVDQIRPVNGLAIAQQQYQDHGSRAAYVAETLQTGAYQHIQAAARENPVHPAMAATPNQRMGQEVFAAMAASHNLNTQGSSNTAGAQMTSIDIQQAHQTRQLAQVQADYIREVSRGMDEMVQSLGNLGEHFENFFNKADGKVNDKA